MRRSRQDGAERAGDTRIQGAYDYCGGKSAFIIADVTTDDAWMAIERGEAASVETHR